MNYQNQIKQYLSHEIETLQKIDVEAINAALVLLRETLENKKKVFIFGNGGSSSTASHFQTDFNKGVSEHIPTKFKFICLNDNISTLMAIANDIGFEETFRFQLIGRLKPGDICVAISGSGNSKNIINAVEYAKSQGNRIIGLTGYTGGKLKELSDISLHVPINSMQITEDIHLIFDHLMMSIFCKELCGIEHIKNMNA